MRAWAEMFDAFLSILERPRRRHLALHRRRLLRARRRQAALRRRAGPADGARHPAARRRSVRPARGRDGVRAGKPQERRLQRRAGTATASPPTRARSPCSTRCATMGMPLAVVSSSANAPAVLEAAGLAGRFVTVVDGRVATALGLAGKPAPDTFVHAATECGTTPARSVVVEDAVSGVRAGAAGGFGLVIGVDRGAGAETLTAAGARPRRRPTSGTSREAPSRLDRTPSTAAASPSTPGGWSSATPTAATSASPRPCSRSRTATSACAATPRRAATRSSTAPTSTASTRPGRSGTPRRPTGSRAPGRPSSTRPTPSS